jgi:hypothetical protein
MLTNWGERFIRAWPLAKSMPRIVLPTISWTNAEIAGWKPPHLPIFSFGKCLDNRALSFAMAKARFFANSRRCE